MSTTALPRTAASIDVDGVVVTIDDLVISDTTTAGHLAALDPEQRADELIAAISIGIRGLEAMGTGATAHRIGEVVERIVESSIAKAELQVEQLLETGRRETAQVLDPEVRSSITARTMTELGALHRQLLDGIDPDRRDSRTARFVAELDELLGPRGRFEQRLAEALDPSADGSVLAQIIATFEQRFQELRDLIVGSTERDREAARGTAKGFAFEDVVEARLRVEAGHLGGAIVERTSHTTGVLGAGALVGDLVVTLPDGTKVVVEAKHTGRITLTGKDGILAELDRAMANRVAGWSLCVSHSDVYPDEVGSFGLYGNRVLVVDDGSGELIRVALRWIASAARQAVAGAEGIDLEHVRDRLDRIRSLATRFSRTKRSLTGVQSSLDGVRSEIDELRTDLLDLVDDLSTEMRRAAADTNAATLVA